MFVNQLLEEAAVIALLNVEDALTVAEYPASGSYIDVSRMERFAFLIGAGALDSAVVAQVHQAKTVSGTPKDIEGATVTIAADGDDKWYLIEVQVDNMDSNNDYNYVTLDITGPAGSNDYACIFFLGFGDKKPVTQHTSKGSSVYVAGGQTG